MFGCFSTRVPFLGQRETLGARSHPPTHPPIHPSMLLSYDGPPQIRSLSGRGHGAQAHLRFSKTCRAPRGSRAASTPCVPWVSGCVNIGTPKLRLQRGIREPFCWGPPGRPPAYPRLTPGWSTAEVHLRAWRYARMSPAGTLAGSARASSELPLQEGHTL